MNTLITKPTLEQLSKGLNVDFEITQDDFDDLQKKFDLLDDEKTEIKDDLESVTQKYELLLESLNGFVDFVEDIDISSMSTEMLFSEFVSELRKIKRVAL